MKTKLLGTQESILLWVLLPLLPITLLVIYLVFYRYKRLQKKSPPRLFSLLHCDPTSLMVSFSL